MTRRSLLLIISSVFSLTMYGQNNIQDKLVSLFQKQLEIFPQEKIYVHTDKPYYILGEKIWFRAYVVDAKSHDPVSVSRYVYVELINPLDTVVARVKIRQEEGVYYGYLPIPDDMPEGNYTMRSYTTFMRNQDENYFFSKTLYIGDPHACAAYQAPTSNNDFDVSFYPEGGSLMQGTFCKVAFKALKSNGQSADISGIVYDQTGKEIKEFKSEHLGMGSFPLLAEKGKTYYAICKNNKGQLKRFDLPAAVNSGYVLSVIGVKDKMGVIVLKPAETTQNEELYLLVHTRGTVHFADRWDPGKMYLIQPEQFPSGILQLVLFDANLNPISERLIFINNNDQAQVSYQPDKESYTARSLVKNRVTLTDGTGQALTGSFSVAITSDKEVQPDSTANILTQFLLTSDLRGNIENPTYYFQNNNSSSVALDLLMCTQGWRRYNIAELVQGHFTQPIFPIVTIPEISGIVKNDLGGTPSKNMEVTILSLKNDYFDKTKTDKDGRFSFRGVEWPDSTSFTVSVKMKKMITAKNLIIDKENFPKRTLRSLPPFTEIDSKQFAQYVVKADRHYILENGTRMIHLPEVKVTAQMKPLRKSMHYNLASHTITAEEIKRFKSSNIGHMLNSMVPGVAVKFNGPLIAGISIRFSSGNPLLLINDRIVDFDDEINSIDINSIEQIDILKGADPFGMRGGNGVIAIYTYRDKVTTDNYNVLHIKDIMPLGYQQPVEFYAPKYETLEKRNAQAPDLRTTIHWEPVVLTDNQGVAMFEFYTADESTSYTVIIEGLANDGSIIRQEGKISNHRLSTSGLIPFLSY